MGSRFCRHDGAGASRLAWDSGALLLIIAVHHTGKKTTLSAALTSLGINSTYSYRKQIAAANGITFYMGTAAQNTQMYNLLAARLLKKV